MCEICFFVLRVSAKTFAIGGSVACAERRNPPHRSRCPGVSDQYVLSTAVNAVLTCFRGGQLSHRHRDLELCWRYVDAIFRSWALAERILCSCRVRCRFWSVFSHLGALHGRFWRGQRRSGEGFGGSNGLFFNVFSSFRVHARWRCAKAPDVQKPQFFLGFS